MKTGESVSVIRGCSNTTCSGEYLDEYCQETPDLTVSISSVVIVLKFIDPNVNTYVPIKCTM